MLKINVFLLFILFLMPMSAYADSSSDEKSYTANKIWRGSRSNSENSTNDNPAQSDIKKDVNSLKKNSFTWGYGMIIGIGLYPFLEAGVEISYVALRAKVGAGYTLIKRHTREIVGLGQKGVALSAGGIELAINLKKISFFGSVERAWHGGRGGGLSSNYNEKNIYSTGVDWFVKENLYVRGGAGGCNECRQKGIDREPFVEAYEDITFIVLGVGYRY